MKLRLYSDASPSATGRIITGLVEQGCLTAARNKEHETTITSFHYPDIYSIKQKSRQKIPILRESENGEQPLQLLQPRLCGGVPRPGRGQVLLVAVAASRELVARVVPGSDLLHCSLLLLCRHRHCLRHLHVQYRGDHGQEEDYQQVGPGEKRDGGERGKSGSGEHKSKDWDK